jgi:hypothetical protein
MSPVAYTCTQCCDQIGFFYASAGMLCQACQQPATQMQEAECNLINMPKTEIEQIVELERMRLL